MLLVSSSWILSYSSDRSRYLYYFLGYYPPLHTYKYTSSQLQLAVEPRCPTSSLSKSRYRTEAVTTRVSWKPFSSCTIDSSGSQMEYLTKKGGHSLWINFVCLPGLWQCRWAWISNGRWYALTPDLQSRLTISWPMHEIIQGYGFSAYPAKYYHFDLSDVLHEPLYAPKTNRFLSTWGHVVNILSGMWMTSNRFGSIAVMGSHGSLDKYYGVKYLGAFLWEERHFDITEYSHQRT